MQVRAGEQTGAQAEAAQQGLDHAGGRGLAVGAGEVDHRVGTLRVGQQVDHCAHAVERRLELGLGPAGVELALDLLPAGEQAIGLVVGERDRLARGVGVVIGHEIECGAESAVLVIVGRHLAPRIAGQRVQVPVGVQDRTVERGLLVGLELVVLVAVEGAAQVIEFVAGVHERRSYAGYGVLPRDVRAQTQGGTRSRLRPALPRIASHEHPCARLARPREADHRRHRGPLGTGMG